MNMNRVSLTRELPSRHIPARLLLAGLLLATPSVFNTDQKAVGAEIDKSSDSNPYLPNSGQDRQLISPPTLLQRDSALSTAQSWCNPSSSDTLQHGRYEIPEARDDGTGKSLIHINTVPAIPLSKPVSRSRVAGYYPKKWRSKIPRYAKYLDSYPSNSTVTYNEGALPAGLRILSITVTDCFGSNPGSGLGIGPDTRIRYDFSRAKREIYFPRDVIQKDSKPAPHYGLNAKTFLIRWPAPLIKCDINRDSVGFIGHHIRVKFTVNGVQYSISSPRYNQNTPLRQCGISRITAGDLKLARFPSNVPLGFR